MIRNRADFDAAFDASYGRGYEAGKLEGDEEVRKFENELKTMSPREARHRIKELRRQLAPNRRKLAELGRKKARIDDLLSRYEDLVLWHGKGLRLERPSSSVLHRLQQSVHGHPLFFTRKNLELDSASAAEYDDLFLEAKSFVIQHDWASAFSNATDYEGSTQFKLPFEICAFEFRVSGRSAIIMATEADGTIYLQMMLDMDGCWFSAQRAEALNAPLDDRCADGTPEPINSLAIFLRPQIKAICVALEAEIAETEIVRAPHKLNRSRERKGRLPVSDYHVVSLARRNRAKPLDEPHPTGARRRLHFRRGHWRHYENFRSWIRWTLVGDPDLGFVDKEYRL